MRSKVFRGDRRTRFTSDSLYFSLCAAQVSAGSQRLQVWGVSGGEAEDMPAGAEGEQCCLLRPAWWLREEVVAEAGVRRCRELLE